MPERERHAARLLGLHREIREGVDPDEYLERERASREAGACGRPGRPGEKAEGSRNRPALRKYARREIRRFLEADRVDGATVRKVQRLLAEPVPAGQGEPEQRLRRAVREALAEIQSTGAGTPARKGEAHV